MPRNCTSASLPDFVSGPPFTNDSALYATSNHASSGEGRCGCCRGVVVQVK